MTLWSNKMRRRSKAKPKPNTQVKGDAPPAAVGRADYLTPTQVADRLLVSPVTIRLWASKGLLPSVTTPGGHRRFRVQDVEFLASQYGLPTGIERERKLRVLIIDDDRQFARYLSRLIASHAAEVSVDVADGGFAAGIKCGSNRPDIVTLDLQMPDMDGFEVCAMLREMFGKREPRIVALTGFASAKNAERILAAGANCCVAKTATPEALLRELGLSHVKRS
jgi:excisionase family DNA binding protein